MDGSRLSNRMGLRNLLFHIFRIILGIIFIYASYHKIINPGKFAKVIYNYKIISSPTIINFLAIFLPWLEFFIGIFLIVGIFKGGASTISTLLLLVFIIAIIYTMLKGIDTNCGCFNFKESSKIGFSLLIRDFLFIIISLYVTIYSYKMKKTTI